MTDSLFFDNDCLSAFLWVGDENLLVKLYPGRVRIPKQVYIELSSPGVAHLKARVDHLLANKQVSLTEITVGTEIFDLYYQLTEEPESGHVIIGKGEASCIALAKYCDGIVASNNLKDISSYINELGLKHITTGDILIEAFDRGYITKAEGNTLWSAMLAKHRKLGEKSFTDYLKRRRI
ncbi:hypothetical protein [Desulfitobacterium sp.]|uniref:hypothetical protein n=1 Tax=Desulfitobacterium sp. TaxID=49981 RepID=UPI002D1471BC|nr:hypothetical protein [Desulfitobacterium sp.]HVJ50256.1 hypothetical protein [Desulfitobacterium sp.]